jgi:hypothetical protein
MVGKDASNTWWNGKNQAFDMQTPQETWEKDYNKVYQYLMSHASGQYY